MAAGTCAYRPSSLGPDEAPCSRDPLEHDRERTGVIIGSGIGGLGTIAETFEQHTRNVARWRDIARSLKGDKG